MRYAWKNPNLRHVTKAQTHPNTLSTLPKTKECHLHMGGAPPEKGGCFQWKKKQHHFSFKGSLPGKKTIICTQLEYFQSQIPLNLRCDCSMLGKSSPKNTVFSQMVVNDGHLPWDWTRKKSPNETNKRLVQPNLKWGQLRLLESKQSNSTNKRNSTGMSCWYPCN